MKKRVFTLLCILFSISVFSQELQLSQKHVGLDITFNFKKNKDDFYIIRSNGKFDYNQIVQAYEFQFLKYNLLSENLETNKRIVDDELLEKGLDKWMRGLFNEDSSIGIKGSKYNKKSKSLEIRFLEVSGQSFLLNYNNLIKYDYLLENFKIDEFYKSFSLNYVNNYFTEDIVFALELSHVGMNKVESIRQILLIFKNGVLDKLVEIPNPEKYPYSPIAITKEGKVYFKLISDYQRPYASTSYKLMLGFQDIEKLEEGLQIIPIESAKTFNNVIFKYENDCIYTLLLDKNDKGAISGIRLNAFSAKTGEQILNINHAFNSKFIGFFDMKNGLFGGEPFNMVINRMAFDKDNNPIVFLNVTYISTISAGSMTRDKYHNKGIAVVKFNKEGGFDWSYSLSRNTTFLSERYNASYVPFISKKSGNIHLFFNDLEENMKNDSNAKLKEVNPKNTNILRHVVINGDSGKLLKDKIALNYEKEAPILITNGDYSQIIDEKGTLYLSGDKVFQFGTIELE